VKKKLLNIVMLDSTGEGCFDAVQEEADKYVFHRRQNE
jgi:hypothetical protein